MSLPFFGDTCRITGVGGGRGVKGDYLRSEILETFTREVIGVIFLKARVPPA